MRKLAYSVIGLALAASAVNAQETPDAGPPPGGAEAGAAAPADAAPPATPDDAVPPAEGPLAPEAAPPADEPAAPAPDDAVAGNAFTDEQVDQFAEATVKVQAIDADASIAAEEKQSQMAAAVTETGLDPATYNKIGQAIAVDPELRSRVQVAMARHNSGKAPAPTDG